MRGLCSWSADSESLEPLVPLCSLSLVRRLCVNKSSIDVYTTVIAMSTEDGHPSMLSFKTQDGGGGVSAETNVSSGSTISWRSRPLLLQPPTPPPSSRRRGGGVYGRKEAKVLCKEPWSQTGQWPRTGGARASDWLVTKHTLHWSWIANFEQYAVTLANRHYVCQTIPIIQGRFNIKIRVVRSQIMDRIRYSAEYE